MLLLLVYAGIAGRLSLFRVLQSNNSALSKVQVIIVSRWIKGQYKDSLDCESFWGLQRPFVSRIILTESKIVR